MCEYVTQTLVVYGAVMRVIQKLNCIILRLTGLSNLLVTNQVNATLILSFWDFFVSFKFSKKIENLTNCEVQAVIRVLNAQNEHPIEIYCQLIAVYGEGEMNDSDVRNWCRIFNKGRQTFNMSDTGTHCIIHLAFY
jgi:hypothetical protein